MSKLNIIQLNTTHLNNAFLNGAKSSKKGASVNKPTEDVVIYDYYIKYTSAEGKITPRGGTLPKIMRHDFDKNTKNGVMYFEEPVTFIGDGAFREKALVSIEIPNTVTSIGHGAFLHCEHLKEVNIPYNVTTIEENTFVGCTSLTKINIPDSVTSIGYSAFASCTSFTEINIPDSVINIEAFAFSGCNSVSITKLGKNVKNVGLRAFQNVGGHIEISSSIPSIYDVDGLNVSILKDSKIKSVAFSDEVTIISAYCCQDIPLETVSFGKNIQEIGPGAFQRCKFSEAILPDSIKSIGAQAFYNTPLSNIYLGLSLETIDSNAFASTKLTSIELPNNVKTIGSNAFAGCGSLSFVSIPASVTAIGEAPFKGNNGALEISVNSDNPKYAIVNNCLYDKESLSVISYTIDKIYPEVNIPNGTMSIMANAFINCKSLISVAFPDSLSVIEKSAFEDCSSLISLNLPALERLEDEAFDGCDNLQFVTLSKIERLYGRPFRSCTGVLTLTDTINENNNYDTDGSLAGNFSKVICEDIPGISGYIAYGLFSGNKASYFEFKQGTISNIYDYAFRNTKADYDFSQLQSVPRLNSSLVFENATIGKIIVGDSLYNKWVSAQYWSELASYIIRKSDWDSLQV